MEPKEASKKIAELIAQAQALVNEAESVSDASGVGFDLDLGGYGMGGWYVPVPEGANPDEEDRNYARKYGWKASIHLC